MADDVDVLIVGGGPVGLSLGIQCGRYGVRARVIDKLPKPSTHSKALALWSSALEALEAMGCSGAVIAAGIEVRQIRISAESAHLADVDVAREVESRYSLPILLPQSETERILTERLQELGGKVERGSELLSFEEEGNGVVCQVLSGDGSVETVRSRWLAGCDGAHSSVRRGAAIDFLGEALEDTFALADVVIDPSPDEDAVHLDWSEKGVLALFPVRPGLWRVVANRRNNEWGAESPTLEEINEHFANHGYDDWRASDPEWLSVFHVSERQAETFRKGRVMLLGDAAHVHSPAGGQGMNTGIQDAFNLGWKLGLLAAGRGDEDALLESYDAERSQVAEMVLKAAAMRTKVSLLKNPVARLARNTGLRIMAQTEKFQADFAEELSGLAISYEESPVIDNDIAWHEDWRSQGFGPGTRVRSVDVYCPRRKAMISLLDEMAGGGHAVVLFSGRKPKRADVEELAGFESRVRELAGEAEKFVRVWRGSTAPEGADWLLDRDAEAHLRYGVEQMAAYVVRPDGFVAFRCSPLDAELMAGYAELVFERAG